MSHGLSALVLEVARQENKLLMSVFEQGEAASTIKHYSQLDLVIPQINRACQEVTSILHRSTLKSGVDTDFLHRLEKTGQFLWDHLLTGQVKNRLIHSENKELLLSLDEELISIPWELLHDRNQFFCLKFNLGRVVRTKEQFNQLKYRSANSDLRMLILANPTNDLKSSYLEGVYIKNQLDRYRKYLKVDFKSTQIDSLYLKRNLMDYDIVHFAGHCEYESRDSGNTGWLLSDARFTTRDILALSGDFSLPSLVFSNACYSAKAGSDLINNDYQEKTYSLAAAFLFSGVRHYIGTIWKIEDPNSLLFAREFYSHLVKGKTIGECIRLSRLGLIKEYGLCAISWANYILYGDPNFTLFNSVKTAAKVPKVKVRYSLYKKYLKKIFLFLSVTLVCLFLYIYLPAKNPNSYFLFLKAQGLFNRGDNFGVIALAEKILHQDPLFLTAYPLFAKAAERLGERQKCLKYYFDYAFYSQKRNDLKNLTSAYIGIGWTYYLMGDYAKSFEFYEKAGNLSKKTGDKLDEAIVTRKLAVWYTDKEDFDKALELLVKSSEINRDRQNLYEHRYNLACDYFDIGLVFSDKNDFEAAKEFYKKSKAIFEKMKLKGEMSDYYFNLGELYLFDKQYDKALKFYLLGLKIDQALDNRPGIAGDYNMIGELYSEMGNLSEAEKFFKESAEACQKLNLKPELASAYYNLALLYKQKGLKNSAKEYLLKAEEFSRNIDTPFYRKINQKPFD